ncbi:MAG: hypothetical protein CL897_04645 [Dehalococcoidia bacterium]|nr:hypothetical protein [Dehalococcoidia bacterium]HCV00914.1 hypothetical protein [Dehalococcoidia bacterium]
MLSRRSSFPQRGPVSERVFGRAYAEAEHGGRSLAAGLFAIALFLFIVSLSVFEMTQPNRAQTLLAAGLASLTDIDQFLEENIPSLQEEARSSDESNLEVPDYPLPVTLSRLEVLTADTETIRALVLHRSAKVVYATGLDAFDETGEQAAEILSVSNVIRELVGFLTGDIHGQARWVVLASLIAATVMGAATLQLNRGFSRFTSFGLAVLLASAPGYLFARGGSYLVDRFGSEDAFVVDLQTVAQAMLAVPERNFLIAGSIGLTVAVAGRVLGLVSDYFFSDQPLDPMAYDTGPAVPFPAVPGPTQEFVDQRRVALFLSEGTGLRQRLFLKLRGIRANRFTKSESVKLEANGIREDDS